MVSKDSIFAAVEKAAPKLIALSDWMYENPEIGHQEHESAARLIQQLRDNGFVVEAPYAGMATAFRATYKGGEGPVVAILAEYDALPGIGHGCGHNIIGTLAVLSAIGLKNAWPDMPGTILVLGAPAEEGAVDNAGGKVFMVEHGTFAGVDVAMMIHPSLQNALGGSSNAREAMEIVFKGKTAHAAGAPHEGINALDAAIQTFNGFNALRQHVKPDVRIHGIIKEGGLSPNIVPDRAVIRMYARAADSEYLKEVVEKVHNCARAGAMAAGAGVEIRQTAKTYKNMINNKALGDVWKHNVELQGEKVSESVGGGAGSTDMANVSHEVPSIHPYISISSRKVNGHSTAFADATISQEGHKGLVVGAKSLAGTAADLLSDAGLLSKIKEEFAASVKR
jgi:amidohydrolase